MIYRLFRKELSVRSVLQASKPEKSQSLFIEQISRMIKILKKREQLYSDCQEKNVLNGFNNNEQLEKCMKQYEYLVEETNQIKEVLLGFKQESYFSYKAYLYTAFMRVTEMIEKFKTKYRNDGKREVQKSYQDFKKMFSEVYNQQIYQEKYEILQLLQLVIKNQSSRIIQFFPKKKKNPLSPINNSKKILDQLKTNSSNIGDLKKKCLSIQMPKNTDLKLQQLVNKKLLPPQLATSKRLQQRKKQKVKPKILNLFKLYDVLQIKPIVVEKTYIFKVQLQQSMKERNQVIKQQMKKWEKRYFARKQKK